MVAYEINLISSHLYRPLMIQSGMNDQEKTRTQAKYYTVIRSERCVEVSDVGVIV